MHGTKSKDVSEERLRLRTTAVYTCIHKYTINLCMNSMKAIIFFAVRLEGYQPR